MLVYYLTKWLIIQTTEENCIFTRCSQPGCKQLCASEWPKAISLLLWASFLLHYPGFPTYRYYVRCWTQSCDTNELMTSTFINGTGLCSFIKSADIPLTFFLFDTNLTDAIGRWIGIDLKHYFRFIHATKEFLKVHQSKLVQIWLTFIFSLLEHAPFQPMCTKSCSQNLKVPHYICYTTLGKISIHQHWLIGQYQNAGFPISTAHRVLVF